MPRRDPRGAENRVSTQWDSRGQALLTSGVSMAGTEHSGQGSRGGGAVHSLGQSGKSCVILEEDRGGCTLRAALKGYHAPASSSEKQAPQRLGVQSQVGREAPQRPQGGIQAGLALPGGPARRGTGQPPNPRGGLWGQTPTGSWGLVRWNGSIPPPCSGAPGTCCTVPGAVLGVGVLL